MTDLGDEVDPQDDPDFISQEGVGAPMVALPGRFSPGLRGSPNPVFVPSKSTSLEEDDPDSLIPPAALWAMKYQQHSHFLSRAEADIRESYGTGNHTVYVMDDGRKLCKIGRVVGTDAYGCVYTLVANVTMETYDELVADASVVDTVFDGASDICLCSVFVAEEAVSNVSVVEHYRSIDDVPPEYLPPNPPIEFADTPGSDY